MSNYEFYLVEKNPPIAWIYLNRPDKKNALNSAAFEEAIPIIEDLDRDDAVRCVIITGKGSCFSAGLDLPSMEATVPEIKEKEQQGGIKWRLVRKIKALQDAITCIERCRKPFIAAIHGYCIGGGLDMAAACDIRLSTEDAIFSLREAAVAFVADLGVLQRMPRIVGQGITRELAYTAKNIRGARAKEVLLVNEVFKSQRDLLEGAEKMAMDIAENSPLAVQATKDVLNYEVSKSIDDGLKYVTSISSNITPSDDLREAVAAFAAKRKPRYTGK